MWDGFSDHSISLVINDDCRYPAWWLGPEMLHLCLAMSFSICWHRRLTAPGGCHHNGGIYHSIQTIYFVSKIYRAWKPCNGSKCFSISSVLRWSKKGKYRDRFSILWRVFCLNFGTVLLPSNCSWLASLQGIPVAFSKCDLNSLIIKHTPASFEATIRSRSHLYMCTRRCPVTYLHQ